MNGDLVPSETTIHHQYGSNELQMQSWEMSMHMYSDGNLLEDACSLLNGDNQSRTGGFAQPLHYSSPLHPHTGYEMGSSSLDEILRHSASFNHKLSIPHLKSEFPYKKRTRLPHKMNNNNALFLTTSNDVKKKKLLQSKVPLTKKNNKLSEKITILQKLVSPYGKADTASVLEETSLYIKLLQQQIRDLFHILVRSYDVARATTTNSKGTSEEEEEQNLRSKGLCLVPLSFSRKNSQRNRDNLHLPFTI